MLIIARQWIIQANIEKNANLKALMSASLRELLVSERIEKSILSLGETTDPAARDTITIQIRHDLPEWEEFHRQVNDRFPQYLKSGDASDSA